MFVRISSRLGNATFFHQNVATRTLSTQIAAKIDPTVTNSKIVDYTNAAPYSSIPGPSALSFVLANMPGGKLYKKDLRELIRSYRQEYGDLVKLPSVFGKPEILISHNPNHFQILFRTEGAWPERLTFDAVSYYRKKRRPDIYDKYQGLLNTQGQEWGDFRTAVNPVMIQPKTAKQYIPSIDEVANDFVQRIRQIRNPSTNQLPENFEEELNKWSLESIGVIAMDARFGLISEDYNEFGVKFMENLKMFFQIVFDLEFKPSLFRIIPTPTFNKLMKVLDTLTDIACHYIEEAKARLEANANNDLEDHQQSVLEKLLKIDPSIAKVMAMEMVFAGVDTTSSAFTAALYLLAINPEKQEILRKEIMTVLPQKDSAMTIENMSRLPYLRACIKEAQRILPTANGNVRAAGQDLLLDGYRVPKGTHVLMSGTVLQMEDKHFSEAKKFLPERWLKQETQQGVCPASAKSAHPFIYLPFGFGPRMCIGRRFAEFEIEILISRLIRNFNVRWEHPDLKFKCTTLNAPDGKLMFTLHDVQK